MTVPVSESGTLVRLHVPDWFAASDFQAWFNRNLGKGLATWQPADQPLEQMVLGASECGEYLERLRRFVLRADVLIQADALNEDHRIAQVCRREEAKHVLNLTAELLENAIFETIGISIDTGRTMDDRLQVSVLDNDALRDARDESEQQAVDEAVAFLNELKSALTTVCDDLTASRIEYSDCFVSVDPSCNGEGPESDMPEPYWSQIVEAARKARTGDERTHIIVQLSPV